MKKYNYIVNMKSLLLYTVFFFCTVVGYAQNLVPNPSFEDTVGCPNATGEINKATGWTTLCVSPDFFNTCYTIDPYSVGVPYNFGGFQFPASGNGYAGFATYSNSALNAREFPACNLSTSLSIGTKYYISFKVVLALTNYSQANCATDKIGIKFLTGAYSCNSLITNNPSIYTNAIITDSLNWTRISGSFIADSAYTYLAIGNFFDDANTDTLKFFNDFSDNAYYFLDDVCVSTDSLYANSYNYTSITENNLPKLINFYPNPVLENLTIQNLSYQELDIDIYNVLDELSYTLHNVSEKTLSIYLGNLKAGLLFIKIKSGPQIKTYKLLKL